MTYRYRNIAGSLNALLVLETVVRHLSFTRAAAELSLSQPTISRHKATLESRLNQDLIKRTGNRVIPTQAANRLASAVSLGFGHAETAWEEILQISYGTEVTLACSFGFAENWLMPRYAGLKQILGDTQLRIATFDQLNFLDMSRIDLAVVWDTSITPERPFFPLFTEEAFPVCSRDYLNQRPDIAHNIQALTTAELLHFDVGDSGFINWCLWFAAHGIDYRIPPGMHRYDTLPFVMQAILDGEGVGIGWRYLVDRMIEDGRLVQIGPSVENRKAACYLQYRTDLPEEHGSHNIKAWFKKAIRTE